MFAIMSKVGIYVILRLWLLVFGEHSGASAHFGYEWLLAGSIATIAFGVIGALASQDLARLASFMVLISSGTVLAAIAIYDASVTGPAVFYLVSSTVAIGAFFMLIELLERGRDPFEDMLAVTREAYGEDEDEEEEEIGIAVPAILAILGICFIGCALVLAGLPPLSGFVAKFTILTAVLTPPSPDDGIPGAGWVLLAVLLISGLMTLIAMTRAGIRTLWAQPERSIPRVSIVEITPIAVLLLVSVTLTVQAEPAMRYMRALAQDVHTPNGYVNGVLARPAPPATKAEGGQP
jgi:multicomponent K+:H+ antiporter subunit D